MRINWKARVKNKTFWITLIPTALVVLQAILAFCGIEYNVANLSDKLVNLIDAIFGLLAVLGIVVDHTTQGFSDSDRAMKYEEPN